MKKITIKLFFLAFIAIVQVAQATVPPAPVEWFVRKDYNLGNFSINGQTFSPVDRQEPWSMFPNDGVSKSIQEYCNKGSRQEMPYWLYEYFPYTHKALPAHYYLTCRLDQITTLGFSSPSYEIIDEITPINNYWCPNCNNQYLITKHNFNMAVNSTTIGNPYMKLYNQQNELIAEGISLNLTQAQQLKTTNSTYLILKVYTSNGNDLCETKIYGSNTNKAMAVRDAVYANGVLTLKRNSTAFYSNSSNAAITITDCSVNAFELTFEDDVHNISGTVNNTSGKARDIAFTDFLFTSNPKVVWALWPADYTYKIGNADVVTISMAGKPYTFKINKTNDSEIDRLSAPVITSTGCNNTNPAIWCTVTNRNISYTGWDKVEILTPGISSYTGNCFDSKNNATLMLTAYKNYCRKDFPAVDAKPEIAVSTLKPELQVPDNGQYCPSSNVAVKITNYSAYNDAYNEKYEFYAKVGQTNFKFINGTLTLINPVVGQMEVFSQTKDNRGCKGVIAYDTLKYYPGLRDIVQPNNVTACQGAILAPLQASPNVEGLAYYIWIAKDGITGKSDTVIGNSFNVPTDRATVKNCRLIGVPFCNVSPPYYNVEKTFTITINALPAAITVTAVKEGLCNGEKAIITASDATLTYKWFAKNGEIAGQTTPILAQSFADGFDTVYALGTNSNGCSITTSKIVIEAVTPSTNLRFSGSYSSCPEGKLDIRDYMRLDGASLPSNITSTLPNGLRQYTFSSNKNGLVIDTVNWQINMGESYSKDYQLYLHARKAFSTKQGYCETKQDSIAITVNDAPDPFIIRASDSGVVCNLVKIDLQTSANFINWLGNGQVIGQTSSFSHDYELKDTTIIYSADAFRGYGCHRKSSNQIKVDRRFVPFNIEFIYQDFDYCETSVANVDLFNLINGTNKGDIQGQNNGYSYSFNTNAPTSGTTLLLPSANRKVSYPISLTASKNGCSKTIDSRITVYQVPGAATITGSLPTNVCYGDTVNIPIQSANATKYSLYYSVGPVGTITGVHSDTIEAVKKYVVTNGTNRIQVAGSNPGCGTGAKSAIATVKMYNKIDVLGDIVAERDDDNLSLAYIYCENVTNANSAFVKLVNNKTKEQTNVGTYPCTSGEFFLLEVNNVAQDASHSVEITFTSAQGCSLKVSTVIMQVGTAGKKTTKGTSINLKKLYHNETDKEKSTNAVVKFDFSIYPNPAKDKLTIQLNGEAEFVQIMNVLGMVILKENLQSTLSKEFEVGNLKPGTYFVGVFDGSRMHTKKLVILK